MKQQFLGGEELRQRRIEMGFTPLDVSRKIHVPVSYIEAIERGDIRALPPVCYTTGFIKSYCNLLGLDATPFLNDYAAIVRPPRRRSFWFNENRKLILNSKAANVLTWVAICAVLALSWVAYMFIVNPKLDDPSKHVEAGAMEIVEPFPPGVPGFK
ncbi:MAG TPA: helix-turn-helix domain-containing protein [Candidatus Hydrogenedentes bacterium]|nr:helix-turn-helix domain-containing protein [Candidatus Hydrogenedentota bacterium]HOL77126.1 helix-turn-helix domain-containing protein [Candidatus Hydrogenedentota bacterium]HPO86955.1 helix-turn-helix domain-containing protein [Candidatus Hydrogenedentota bacterium]